MSRGSGYAEAWRGKQTPANPRLELLVAILTNHVDRPGALCVGQAPLFDRNALDGETEAAHHRRTARAATICGRCPEQDTCPDPFG